MQRLHLPRIVRRGAIGCGACKRNDLRRRYHSIGREQAISIREQRMRLGQLRIEGECLLESLRRGHDGCATLGDQHPPMQQQLVRLDMTRAAPVSARLPVGQE